MARHEVALRGRNEVAEGTLAFRFDKPAGFTFKAGQSVSVALIDPPAEPNSSVCRSLRFGHTSHAPPGSFTSSVGNGACARLCMRPMTSRANTSLRG